MSLVTKKQKEKRRNKPRLLTPAEIRRFRARVFDFYTTEGRHDLPWRRSTRAPYQVLVSEIMLQQTQVDRVLSFYKRWMKKFPNFKQLAAARQADVLRLWKGLGYNSRALRLHQLAREIVSQQNGRLPRDRSALEALPGVGPYTAGAVRVFAFGESDIFIETNIRRVFIHHFFPDKEKVADAEILDLVTQTLPKQDIFAWYSALMDYGASLPKTLKKNPNTQSRHHTKQSKFEGSDRQIRGKILEILLEHERMSKKRLFKYLGDDPERYKKVLMVMAEEGFVMVGAGSVSLR